MPDESVKQTHTEIKTGKGTGRKLWVKGQSGNPNGRPRVAEIDQLRTALANFERENGISLIELAVRKCLKSERLMEVVLKKVLPDKIEDETLKNFARTFLIRAAQTNLAPTLVYDMCPYHFDSN